MAKNDIKLVPISSLKKGSYIVIDGAACTVKGTQTSRPGKHGHAKVRLTAKGIIDDQKRVIVMPGHEKVETPIILKKNAQVLSISGDTANVMDMESYETFDLEIPDDIEDEVSEGNQILYWEILEDKIMKQVKS